MKKTDADAIAVEALNFLAADATRLVRFLDLSGLEPASIRAAARDPAFLAGVLDYINADESLLMTFADTIGIRPNDVGNARVALGGQTWERDVP